jgi:periplasmic divalent cation tolerance protein
VTDGEVCELIVTAPDADWLIEFGRRLVIDHLAASVHSLSPIRSIYEWQGKPYDRTESRAAIHTRTELVAHIIER